MKDEILQKAFELFVKHGIRKMSNQKLAELLGISTKTIYKFFKNKEGFLEEVLQFHHLQQYEMLKNLSAEKSAACIFYDFWLTAVKEEYSINNLFFSDLHYYYQELEWKIEALAANKFIKEFLLIIQRGIEEETFRKDIIPDVVLDNIFLQFVAIARSEQFKRFRVSSEDIMLNTIATTIRGICTVKGAKELDEHIQIQQLFVKAKDQQKSSGKSII
jgi:AcrR family transcriptional regulator